MYKALYFVGEIADGIRSFFGANKSDFNIEEEEKMKKRKLLSVLVAAALGCSLFAAVPVVSQAADTTGVNMYRIYNPNSGEHFYTKNASEKDGLVTIGWKDEGIGWIAPEKSNTPVYRLYNPNSGDHHYTTSSLERQTCINAGWNDEGIGWYSDDNKTVPLYREYNPNALTGTHNYTTDKGEHDSLVKAGWEDENIGWYAIGEGVRIGDTVILGTYEQDDDFDLTNGPAPIEWQVIGTRDGHTLLLSKYALDCKLYDGNRNTTWEKCTLRSWLNDEFYNTAFSASDKERIVTAHNENLKSYSFYSLSKSAIVTEILDETPTDDKVFLLSKAEAENYFDVKTYVSNPSAVNQKPLCSPTPYAKNMGVGLSFESDFESESVEISETGGYCNWWLRTVDGFGYDSSTASYVGHDGFLWVISPNAFGTVFGGSRIEKPIGVRPAILID